MLLKYLSFNLKISKFFFVLFLILFSNFGILKAQSSVKNGSFEKHKTSVYPIDITGALWYPNNQLMKCIGDCQNINKWPPIGFSSYCDEEPSLLYSGGWYWATKNGSVDYFHLKGVGDAKSPLVGPMGGGEMRYPYGYPSPDGLDSAFVGIRLRVRLNPSHKGTYFTDKEYLQSKLKEPMIGPDLYEVKFYVSRTRLVTTSITQMCALFSDTAIVNPFENNTKMQWGKNLAYKTQQPTEYVTSAQICSDFPLDQSADVNGYGGWQEIKGYLQVPQGVTYNYITIGNFQDDYALTVDMYGGNLPPVIDHQFGYEIYYFVDELSIKKKVDSNEVYDCTCKSINYEFDIEKQAAPTDSTKCCYDFKLRIPSKVVASYFCDVRRFKILQGTTVIYDSIAPYPYNYFNGYHVNGSFCIDDFPVENNKFTIQLFTDTDSLMLECTKDFTLNCFCVCSDMSEMFNLPGGPKLHIQKVDSSASGRCCWDIMLTNSASDSSACKFDLSNKYLIIDSDVPTSSYEFFYDEFTLTNQTPFNKILKAPSDFILNFGESKRIGTICSKGIPSVFNEIELNFVLSNTASSHDSVKCATKLTRKLSCDSVTACCDLFTIVVDTVFQFPIDSSWSYCGAYFSLDYKDTPDYCNFDDSLSIVISNETMEMDWLGTTLKLSDALTFPIPISPMVFFGGFAETFCIKINNLRTEEVCEKCIVMGCNSIGTHGPQNDLHKGLPDIQLESEEIKLIPNPTDDIVDVYFNSKVDSDSEISIYSLMGEEVLTKTIKVKKGRNSTRLSTRDLPSALYYLKINIDGKIMTKPIMVAR